jgi:hypothetical protein
VITPAQHPHGASTTPTPPMRSRPPRGAWRLPVALLLASALLAWIAWFGPWNRRPTTVTVEVDGPLHPAPKPASPPVGASPSAPDAGIPTAPRHHADPH